MLINPLYRQTLTFVVRIWAEYLSDMAGYPPDQQRLVEIRGEIQSLGREEIRRFGSLAEMEDLIRNSVVQSLTKKEK